LTGLPYDPVVRRSAAIMALALVTAACGGNDGSSGGGGDGIEVERADGSKIEFSGRMRAWCRDGSLWILNGDLPGEGDETPETYWIVSVRAQNGDAKRRVTVGPDSDVAEDGGMFVYDAERENELSSAEEDSSGTLEFDDVGCERGARVGVDVDVTLDSEFHDAPSATARGSAEAEIGDPLELPD
jgi:hypothetical protein